MGNQVPKTPAKILVADDDAAVREMLSHFLRAKGYDVVLACDGVEVLEKVRSENPKVILLDIAMPRKDGIEVLREIKESGSSVGVIMLTVITDESVGREALSSGAFDYVIKPFDLEYLEKVLWWKLQLMG